MKIKDYEESADIPDNVNVKVEKGIVTVSSSGKDVSRDFSHKQVRISVKENKVVVSFKKGTRREKMMARTFLAHIKNMFKGATQGHVYKLKICSGHFPMNVTLKGNDFSVTNFLGEKKPRIMKIKNGASVKIDGDHIIVEGTSKELTSQTAASIEKLTKIKGRDLRIFQDGIYIIDKDGEPI